MDSDAASDELSPLPQLHPSNSVPTRLRRRPPINELSIAANTELYEPAAPAPDQVISSLISSLSAISISESAQPDLFAPSSSSITTTAAGAAGADGALLHHHPPSSSTPFARTASPDSFYADIPLRRDRSPDRLPYADPESDGESAIPPVVHLSRSPSSTAAKKSRRNSALLHLAAITSLSHKNSMHSLRSHDGSVGFPSIERANGSSNSLPLSMRGLNSRSSSKTREPERYHSNSSMPRSLAQRSYPDMAPAQLRGNTSPRFSFDMSHEPVRRSSVLSAPESAALAALSPLNRDDLQEHLIPSRLSSLRRNGSLVEERESHRLSVGSRSLRDLKIDQDLLESDDYTVRRIRELQEAREKRQLEGRKEARKEGRKSVDRPTKRHSIPSPKTLQSSNSSHRGKLSVTEVLVESDQEGILDMSTTVSDDMGIMHQRQRQLQAPFAPHDIHHSATYSRLTAAARSWQNSDPPTRAISTSSSLRQAKRNSTGSRAPAVAVAAAGTTTTTTTTTTTPITTSAAPIHIDNDPIRAAQDEVDTFLSSPRLTQKIRHPRTGRTIAFSEVGDPNGFAVICCVGMGLTRYVTTFYDDLARTLKLRLITPDRPGVGESEAVPERLHNPLTWVDDVAIICQSLEISRFSLLAHSAGAIYALATALKMPQFVRGRIHLLAPWIPPSQMPKGAAFGPDAQPITNLPMTHRLLSVLPSSVLKVANSRFLAGTAASSYSDSKLLKKKTKYPSDSLDHELSSSSSFAYLNQPTLDNFLNSSENQNLPSSPTKASAVPSFLSNAATNGGHASPGSRSGGAARPGAVSPQLGASRITPEIRASLYNEALTRKIWSLATLHANPAADLMICLERKRPIGFRYADVTRSTVITHGAKDSRVPLDNVRWLNSIMKRCELRVLEEEGHSLMANASVMSSILTEKAKEWDEWEKIAGKKEKKRQHREESAGFMMRGPRSVLSAPGLAAKAAAQAQRAGQHETDDVFS